MSIRSRSADFNPQQSSNWEWAWIMFVARLRMQALLRTEAKVRVPQKYLVQQGLVA